MVCTNSQISHIRDIRIAYSLFVAGDGGAGDWTATGWQPWYSDEGFNTGGGNLGSGQSLHITNFPNASLDFTFYGNFCLLSLPEIT